MDEKPKVELYSTITDKIIQDIKTAQNDCSSFTPLIFKVDSFEEFNLLSKRIEKLPGVTIESFQYAPHLGKDTIVVTINVAPIASGDVY